VSYRRRWEVTLVVERSYHREALPTRRLLEPAESEYGLRHKSFASVTVTVIIRIAAENPSTRRTRFDRDELRMIHLLSPPSYSASDDEV
jgi:hypothetical protein